MLRKLWPNSVWLVEKAADFKLEMSFEGRRWSTRGVLLKVEIGVRDASAFDIT